MKMEICRIEEIEVNLDENSADFVLFDITKTTKSKSRYSKSPARFIYHIKRFNLYYQYYIHTLNENSMLIRCVNKSCDARLNLKFG